MSMAPPEPTTPSGPGPGPQTSQAGGDPKRNAVYGEGGLGTPTFHDFRDPDPDPE